MTKFQGGEKIKFNGQTAVINHRQYAGCIGTVDFQCPTVAGVPGLVYVNLRAPGQRKDRCVALHQDSLELIA